MVYWKQDGVGDGRGEEELENVMAVRQQDGDGRLLPCGLPVLDQAITERSCNKGNTSIALGVRDPRAVHPIGRSRLVFPAGSPEQAGHVEFRPARP